MCAHAHTYAIEKAMNLKERKEEWIGGLHGRSAGSPGYSLSSTAENQVETCNFSSREAKAEAQKFKVILSSTELEVCVEYQDPVSNKQINSF